MRTGLSDMATLALLGLGVVACAPPPITSDGGTTTKASGEETSVTTTDTSSASTETSTETSAGSEVTSNFTDFVPDVPPPPPNCDSFLQDCPEGEKCVPYASSGGQWDAHKCVPILGDQATGEPCVYEGVETALDDCDGSGMCWNTSEVEGELVGTCHEFCTGSPDDPMCPPDAGCVLGGDSVITLCIPYCDPIVQDCDEGLGCYWSGNNFTCTFTTENLEPGEACGFINDCAPGQLCVDAEVLPEDCEGSACCTPYCDLGLGDDQCAAVPGTSCVSFWQEDEAPAPYEHLGVCILM